MIILPEKLVSARHTSRSLVAISLAGCLLTMACRQDIGLLLRDRALPTITGEVPSVRYTVPDDTVDAIGTNARISIGFSEKMSGATVTTNVGSGTCSGALQVSADNFSSCVPMAANPASSGTGEIYTLTPQAALSANTLYKVRVTAASASESGQRMASDYVMATGFRTGPGADSKSPIGPQAAGFIVPYNGDTNIFLKTKILLYFLEPVAPGSLIINTSDSQCTGSIRLSRDSFTTCTKFRDQGTLSLNGRVLSLTPAQELSASTAYQVDVRNTITDLAGNAFTAYTSGFTTGTASTSTPNSLAGSTPAEGATNISISAYYLITMNRPIDPASLVLNFQDNRCTGAIQISADNFSNCVRLDTRVLLSESFNDIYLMPAGSLGNSLTYKLRVTSDLKDALGDSVSPFVQTSGFTTITAVSGNPVVEHLYLFDSSTQMNIMAPFGVTFSKIMNPATLTINTTNTSCVGGYSFQVSSDNFTTCIRLAAITMNSTNSRFFVYPATPLLANTVYKSRLTAGAQDSGGLLNTLFTGSGVTTEP